MGVTFFLILVLRVYEHKQNLQRVLSGIETEVALIERDFIERRTFKR